MMARTPTPRARLASGAASSISAPAGLPRRRAARLGAPFEMLALVVALAAPVSAEAEAGRFALVVGSNGGLPGEPTLRYAEQDALNVKRALLDVGGFSEDQIIEVLGADAASLRTAVARLKSQLGEGPHERLFVYVSSHGADGVLHLAGSVLPIRELTEFLRAAPVRVGVLVIDACQSGEATRLKGLRPVDEPTPRIEASEIEGRVLISASGPAEYAQESDTLGGSTFTHHFVAGLRGLADRSADGLVTLDEAYAWAWARTIEATFGSRGGVQRPSFSIDLRGTGQLVMAEPLASRSRIDLVAKGSGQWLVVGETTGQVFADVDLGKGPLSLGLPAGRYRLQRRSPEGTTQYRVTVFRDRGVAVATGQPEQPPAEPALRKGQRSSDLPTEVPRSANEQPVHSLVPTERAASPREERSRVTLSLNPVAPSARSRAAPWLLLAGAVGAAGGAMALGVVSTNARSQWDGLLVRLPDGAQGTRLPVQEARQLASMTNVTLAFSISSAVLSAALGVTAAWLFFRSE